MGGEPASSRSGTSRLRRRQDARPRRVWMRAAAVGLATIAVAPTSGPPVLAAAVTRSGPLTTEAARTPDRPSRPIEVVGMHSPQRVSGGAPATSFRINASEWGRIQPRPGQFVWEPLDDAIRFAEDSGARDVLLILGLGPEWAAEPASGSQVWASRPPRSLRLWEDWVTTIATRYRGRGFAYQVWNEANLTTFWTGSVEQMADLTARAFSIIHEVDPTATVVAPSTTLRLEGAFRSFYPAFLDALRQRNWPVDVFSAHTYPAGTGTPADRRRLIRMYLRALREAGAPPLPIWDTEVNYGMAGPGPAFPEQDITGRRAATWVARTYIDSIRLGIARAYWYQQQAPTDFLGIQMWPGTAGARAVRWAYRWVSDREWGGCSRTGVVTRCRLDESGETSWIMWSMTRRATRITVPAGATVACRATGRCRTVTPGGLTSVGRVPLRLGPAEPAVQPTASGAAD